MECTWIYDNNEQTRSKNLADLLSIIKRGDLSNFQIYDSEEILQKATKKNNVEYKSFTELNNGSTSSPTANYAIELGNLMHNYIEHLIKEKYKNDTTIITDSKKSAFDFDKAYENLLKYTSETKISKELIKEKAEQIFELFDSGEKPVLIESFLYADNVDGKGTNVKAKPDLILKKRDKFYIIDFKTSTNSDNVRKSETNIALLHFIKEILVFHGMKADKIECININIHPNITNSIKNSLINQTNSKSVEANSMISYYFNRRNSNNPVSVNNLDKYLELRNIVEEGRNSHVASLETYKIKLQEDIKQNKPIFYEDKLFSAKVTSEGKVVLTVNKEIKSFNNFDEFAKAIYDGVLERTKNTRRIIILALKNKDMSYLDDETNTYTKNLYNQFKKAVRPYFGKQWIVLNIELNISEELGIVLMYNKEKDYYDIINLSNILNLDYNLSKMPSKFKRRKKDIRTGESLLLLNMVPNEVLNKYDVNLTPIATLGNMELFNTFIFLALNKQSLFPDGKNVKIGNVNIISTQGHVLNDSALNNFTPYDNAFKILELESSDITDKFKDAHFFSLFETVDIETKLVDTLGSVALDIGQIYEQVELLSNLETVKEKIDILHNLINNVETSANIDEVRKAEIINAATELITFLSKLMPSEIHKENRWNIDPANTLGTLWDSLFMYDLTPITKTGYNITGVGGLLMSSSYLNPDLLIRNLHYMLNSTITRFTQRTIQLTNELRKATQRYLNHYSGNFTRKFRFDEQFYKNLIQHTDGKIDPSLMFKNPYKNGENLDDWQKEYLEVVLFTINRHRNSIKFDGTYAEFKKLPELYANYINNINVSPESYLTIPLRLKNGAVGAFFKIKGAIEEKNIKSRWQDFISTLFQYDRRLNTVELLELKRKKQKEFKDVPFFYDNDPASRYQLLEAHQPEEFLLNMEHLATDYTFESLRQKELNVYLKYMNNAITYLRHMSVLTGRDYDKQIETILNDATINIYYDDLCSDELKPLVATFGTIKKLESIFTIGGRGVLWAKEELLGFIKNFSHITAKWFKNEYEITPKILAKAYGITHKDNYWESGKRFLGVKDNYDIEKVRALNDWLRINGRDLSIFTDVIRSHKTIFNSHSELIFYNVTAPDNDNRMTLLVAKMLADGTWDAIDVHEGVITYNPEKDARFSYFLANRDRDAVLKKSDRKYIEQRARYQYHMQLLNDENACDLKIDNNAANWGLVPNPYTQKDMDSFKELVGMLYGFYNHEERTLQQLTTWAKLYMMFLTWLPGELKRYFTTGKATSVGKVTHVVDPISGKKLYKKYLPNGLVEKTTEEIDPETGEFREPVYDWNEDSVIGLAVCAAQVIHHTLTGDINWFKNNKNKYTIRNAGLFLFNLIIGCLVGSMLLSLKEESKKKKNEYSALSRTLIDLSYKTTNELNFINSFSSAVGSFNLVQVNYMKKVFEDVSRTISSEGYSALDLANSTIGMVKDTNLIN